MGRPCCTLHSCCGQVNSSNRACVSTNTYLTYSEHERGSASVLNIHSRTADLKLPLKSAIRSVLEMAKETKETKDDIEGEAELDARKLPVFPPSSMMRLNQSTVLLTYQILTRTTNKL